MKECYIVGSPFSCSMVSVEVFGKHSSCPCDQTTNVSSAYLSQSLERGGGIVGCLQSMYRTMLQ